jgi:tetratricopeptide (TPR) repeat protein
MTKENVLFTIIGILIGLISGFFITNSLNQGYIAPAAGVAVPQGAGMPQSGALPGGHPAIPGGGGSAPEVQAAIDKAKQNPEDFEAQMKAAELYYQIQRFDGAVEFLKKANSLQPENQEVIVNLGNANFDAGRYEEAEKWYTKALSKKPDNLDVRTDFGLTFIFREKPDYDRAVTEFKKVLDADPNHVQALQNLAVAYTKKSDAQNASASLAKLEQVDPSNSSLSKLREDVAKLNGN